MSKAFDKVNHYGLYLKLMKRNIPHQFLMVLINWYSKCYAAVRWNGVFSRVFDISCGVRQGGVLSPILFAVYVDDIIVNLRESQLGCSINGVYIGCVMYADDLLLMSASLTSLQNMISICELEAQYLDMKFNASKSMVLRIGRSYKQLCVGLTVSGSNLPYVDKAKYLGVFLSAGRQFKTSLSEAICKFYKSVNSILSKAKGHMDEMVLLNLFEAHCKPLGLLVYACECFAFTKSEYARLTNAWNRIFWKLFKVSDSNCLRDIFLYAGCLPLQADIDKR